MVGRSERREVTSMSTYFMTEAASDVAAAFRVRPVGVGLISASTPRVVGTGLANAVFGKGHPPRGIPL